MSGVEGVLAAHVLLHDSCTCRWVVTRGEVPWSVQHRAHVAAVLAAAGIGDAAAAEARGAERERERIAAEVEAAIPTTGIYSSDHRAIGALQSAVRIIRAGGAS